MNEKNIIKQITQLKDVKPSIKKIDRIHAKVFRDMSAGIEDKKLSQSGNSYIAYISFAILFIFIAIISYPIIQKATHPLYIAARISFASNHYQKAKISFQEAQTQFRQLDNSYAISLHDLISRTQETNDYITELHLNGEKGKYTREQCEEIHKQYAKYLSELHTRLEKEDQKIYAVQIAHYQQQIQTRLTFYNSKV